MKRYRLPLDLNYGRIKVVSIICMVVAIGIMTATFFLPFQDAAKFPGNYTAALLDSIMGFSSGLLLLAFSIYSYIMATPKITDMPQEWDEAAGKPSTKWWTKQ